MMKLYFDSQAIYDEESKVGRMLLLYVNNKQVNLSELLETCKAYYNDKCSKHDKEVLQTLYHLSMHDKTPTKDGFYTFIVGYLLGKFTVKKNLVIEQTPFDRF